jgi:hypothetical protein
MPRNVFELIDRLSLDLEELRRALAPLGALSPSSSVSSKPVRTVTPVVAAAPKAKKARKRISPKVKAMRVLQARYMNLVRGLSQVQKTLVKKAKADGGYEPALKLAASFKK